MTTASQGLWASLAREISTTSARIGDGIDGYDALALVAGYAALRGLKVDTDWLTGSGSYVLIYADDPSDAESLHVYLRDGRLITQ